jgi:hypothetical protein
MIRTVRVLPFLLTVVLAAGCAQLDPAGVAAVDPAAAASSPTPRAPDVAGPGATATPERATPAPVTPAPSTAAPVTPAASPSAKPPKDSVAAARDPFAINLYRKGDFVPQYTFEWCVGASLQMMRNLTDAKVTTAKSTQQRYWELARDRSSSPFGGANPRGWTAALNELGVGPYELVSIPDYDEALRVAARALRETDRSVGLVMWRGRHAWVMSGFESTADPALTDDFDVTGIRVLDPLHPHGNSTWGASPKPNSLLSPARLGKQFVSRDRFRVNLGVPPGYLLILPVEAARAG